MINLKILVPFILLSSFLFSQEEDSLKVDESKKVELKEAEIKVEKKAFERKADRVIYDFSEQPRLNSGSLKEGLQKLPGLIISDLTGIMYQGKPLEVFLDGRPLNIFSDELNAYLEGFPANSIEKVEIITEPGAEFPATSGGAIINIVTSNKVSKYLSATYSNGYGYTNYDKSRHRFNNSLTLNARNKLFAWQVEAGQSFRESLRETTLQTNELLISNNVSDRTNRFYYVNSGLKFYLNEDKLLLNYNFSNFNSNVNLDAIGSGFTQQDRSESKSNSHNVVLTYNKRFKKTDRKLDFSVNYNNNNNDFNQDERITLSPVLDNSYNRNFYQGKLDYSEEINFLDESKISSGLLYDYLDYEAQNFNTTNLDYIQKTYAAYAEFQTEIANFDFILGTRFESYDISGTTDSDNLIPFNESKFFPNFTVLYELAPQILLKANYNKKIRLPDTSQLNPNNTNYQNPNVGFTGNPFLQPTISNNYNFRISAFEYLYFNYSISEIDDNIVQRVRTNTDSSLVLNQENVSESTTHSFNFGIPIPYMLFTKGLKETLKFDFNPDEIDFLYFDVNYTKNILPDVDSKGVWQFYILSQIILPSNINFSTTYTTSTTGGNYNYFVVNNPVYHQLDVNFSKKFLSDDLSISIYLNDVLNTNINEFRAIDTASLTYNRKFDSRRIGFSLTYKIPTKNKPKKEEENLLNSNETEENNGNQIN